MKQSILLILVIFKFKEKVYTVMKNKGQSSTIFYLKSCNPNKRVVRGPSPGNIWLSWVP